MRSVVTPVSAGALRDGGTRSEGPVLGVPVAPVDEASTGANSARTVYATSTTITSRRRATMRLMTTFLRPPTARSRDVTPSARQVTQRCDVPWD